MNPLLLRSMLVTGLLIAALNVIFAGVEYGFGNLPAWFWLAQLLLIPAMLAPARLFPQAMSTPPYLNRAGLYALGWAAPYAVYKLTGDALRPGFNAGASLISVIFTCILFGLLFAAIRKPQ
ncbi:hypothetical protein E5F05_09530 [Deinococcus metallilatus]|uniref:Uncharacterized protein n=1 Tax=Deinococcus metallilatus TaxID=1211322 RepID=A0AAJ5F666_9DEIO|nr:hypothetical protein [Deinococcus metallilatus]MBB5296021.1 hypothetical protein [Deinococcus metallilatus]QBY08160.1 hypothetical protein E5F05_09530 [Deinococcus metallilatus]RXJ11892.1 hypothetical protein ERJ73_08340 [Deinococcus metallilatus]TLK25876.1 hypothetical protein FCS05_12640 [Deinococcus metallilatus]